ncbi:hypothetical protein DYBT9275_03420 [Dyadobacter sp. CECT 9275]|uniref:Helix-hairpin-helix domain-containing protein n=1 Tax=Dyadobacter helix TaxID=2822344 RepID=A0A916JG49_9BACT|nr:helix-hairpin-helix domain-containing protein [Dyadobacter sp. CECT 9275]CAG5004674.1 hypothetical protein DYBT9275_03420 [Dyadobacter sp. CECT 9275]
MFRRILDQLQDFLGISRKQARGAALMMIITLLIVWFPFIFRRLILPHFPVATAPVPTRMLDSVATLMDQEQPDFEEKNNKNNYKGNYSKTPVRPQRLFKFDPNRASIAELEELGIAPFLAKRIEKYRSKGGRFRKKEDLLHIYDFPSDLYQQLEGYIILPESFKKFSRKDSSQERLPKSYPANDHYNNLPKANRFPARTALVPFDINKADTTELIRLRGIGSKLAIRIIRFRDGLGGFHSPEQYPEIFGIDSLALTELNRYAKVLSPITRIKINTADLERLTAHSYLRNKKLAGVIINYRNQHGPYQSIDDLRKTGVLDEKTLHKIGPYLEF